MKDYDKGESGKADPLEAGTKNRKSNKRFKDYEEKDMSADEHKKDV